MIQALPWHSLVNYIYEYDGSLTPRESHAPNCSEDLVIEVTPTEILSYLQLFVKHKQIDIYENYSPRQQIPSRTVTIIAADCRVAVLLKDKCLRSLHHCLFW